MILLRVASLGRSNKIDYMTKKEFIDFVNGLSCNDWMSVHMFLDPSDRDMWAGGTYHPKK